MNFNYYSHLAIKKIITGIHSKLERKVKPEATTDLDTIIFSLIKEIFKNLVICNNGQIFYETKINKNKAPLILGQIRVICSLCDGYNKEGFPVQDKKLVEKLTGFLIGLKTNNNLYEFNNVKWEVQDEGIASVWAGIALIKSYELLKEQTYLDEALSVCQAMLKNLYTQRTSLVHSKEQDFWCLNAAA